MRFFCNRINYFTVIILFFCVLQNNKVQAASDSGLHFHKKMIKDGWIEFDPNLANFKDPGKGNSTAGKNKVSGGSGVSKKFRSAGIVKIEKNQNNAVGTNNNKSSEKYLEGAKLQNSSLVVGANAQSRQYDENSGAKNSAKNNKLKVASNVDSVTKDEKVIVNNFFIKNGDITSKSSIDAKNQTSEANPTKYAAEDAALAFAGLNVDRSDAEASNLIANISSQKKDKNQQNSNVNAAISVVGGGSNATSRQASISGRLGLSHRNKGKEEVDLNYGAFANTDAKIAKNSNPVKKNNTNNDLQKNKKSSSEAVDSSVYGSNLDLSADLLKELDRRYVKRHVQHRPTAANYVTEINFSVGGAILPYLAVGGVAAKETKGFTEILQSFQSGAATGSPAGFMVGLGVDTYINDYFHIFLHANYSNFGNFGQNFALNGWSVDSQVGVAIDRLSLYGGRFRVSDVYGVDVRYNEFGNQLNLSNLDRDVAILNTLNSRYLNVGLMSGIRLSQLIGTKHITSQTFLLSFGPSYFFGDRGFSSINSLSNLGNIGAMITLAIDLDYVWRVSNAVSFRIFADATASAFVSVAPVSPINPNAITETTNSIKNLGDGFAGIVDSFTNTTRDKDGNPCYNPTTNKFCENPNFQDIIQSFGFLPQRITEDFAARARILLTDIGAVGEDIGSAFGVATNSAIGAVVNLEIDTAPNKLVEILQEMRRQASVSSGDTRYGTYAGLNAEQRKYVDYILVNNDFPDPITSSDVISLRNFFSLIVNADDNLLASKRTAEYILSNHGMNYDNFKPIFTLLASKYDTIGDAWGDMSVDTRAEIMSLIAPRSGPGSGSSSGGGTPRDKFAIFSLRVAPILHSLATGTAYANITDDEKSYLKVINALANGLSDSGLNDGLEKNYYNSMKDLIGSVNSQRMIVVENGDPNNSNNKFYFTEEQRALLREAASGNVINLRSGGDGLATRLINFAKYENPAGFDFMIMEQERWVLDNLIHNVQPILRLLQNGGIAAAWNDIRAADAGREAAIMKLINPDSGAYDPLLSRDKFAIFATRAIYIFQSVAAGNQFSALSAVDQSYIRILNALANGSSESLSDAEKVYFNNLSEDLIKDGFFAIPSIVGGGAFSLSVDDRGLLTDIQQNNNVAIASIKLRSQQMAARMLAFANQENIVDAIADRNVFEDWAANRNFSSLSESQRNAVLYLFNDSTISNVGITSVVADSNIDAIGKKNRIYKNQQSLYNIIGNPILTSAQNVALRKITVPLTASEYQVQNSVTFNAAIIEMSSTAANNPFSGPISSYLINAKGLINGTVRFVDLNLDAQRELRAFIEESANGNLSYMNGYSNVVRALHALTTVLDYDDLVASDRRAIDDLLKSSVLDNVAAVSGSSFTNVKDIIREIAYGSPITSLLQLSYDINNLLTGKQSIVNRMVNEAANKILNLNLIGNLMSDKSLDSVLWPTCISSSGFQLCDVGLLNAVSKISTSDISKLISSFGPIISEANQFATIVSSFLSDGTSQELLNSISEEVMQDSGFLIWKFSNSLGSSISVAGLLGSPNDEESSMYIINNAIAKLLKNPLSSIQPSIDALMKAIGADGLASSAGSLVGRIDSLKKDLSFLLNEVDLINAKFGIGGGFIPRIYVGVGVNIRI